METKTLTYKTEAKAKSTKSKTSTMTKAVKICLDVASRRGTASRHWQTVPDRSHNIEVRQKIKAR